MKKIEDKFEKSNRKSVIAMMNGDYNNTIWTFAIWWNSHFSLWKREDFVELILT